MRVGSDDFQGDPYSILGIRPEATDDMIRAAFRKQSLRVHPDATRNIDSTAFERLRAAYGLLKDPEQRRLYDTSQPKPSSTSKSNPGENEKREDDRPDYDVKYVRPRRRESTREASDERRSQFRPSPDTAPRRKTKLVVGCFSLVLLAGSLFASIGYGMHVGSGGFWMSGTVCGVLCFLIAVIVSALLIAAFGKMVVRYQEPSIAPFDQDEWSRRETSSGNPPPSPDYEWLRATSAVGDASGKSSTSKAQSSTRPTSGPPPRERSRVLEDRLLELIERGNKIQAIKLARKMYGMSLMDAKRFVDEMSS